MTDGQSDIEPQLGFAAAISDHPHQTQAADEPLDLRRLAGGNRQPLGNAGVIAKSPDQRRVGRAGRIEFGRIGPQDEAWPNSPRIGHEIDFGRGDRAADIPTTRYPARPAR